jgi:hypothetical protein
MPTKTTFYSVPALNKTLRKLPKSASAKLRDASQVIAGRIADDAAGRARSLGGLAALVAPTIRSGRDRVPVVRMGDSSRLPLSGNGWERDRSGSRQTVGDIIWGAEFGGGARSTTQQFQPWRGSGDGAGYFLWPTVRDDREFIRDEYSDALLDALKEMKPSGNG